MTEVQTDQMQTGGVQTGGVPTAEVLARATFDGNGLLPAIIQQYDTGEVLMMGWMDAEALRRTLTEGRTTFWSRSRQEYWRKGDTSGNVQYVKTAALDCDADTLLVQVDQIGAACHTGERRCFDVDPLQVVVGGPAAERASADVTDGTTGLATPEDAS